jgi:hypothetical protein
LPVVVVTGEDTTERKSQLVLGLISSRENNPSCAWISHLCYFALARPLSASSSQATFCVACARYMCVLVPNDKKKVHTRSTPPLRGHPHTSTFPHPHCPANTHRPMTSADMVMFARGWKQGGLSESGREGETVSGCLRHGFACARHAAWGDLEKKHSGISS